MEMVLISRKVYFLHVILETPNKFKCVIISYDLNTRKEIPLAEESQLAKENNALRPTGKDGMYYFGKFDKVNGKYILAGGANPHEARLLDISNRTYATFYGYQKELFTGDFSHDNQLIALSGADGIVRIYAASLE